MNKNKLYKLICIGVAVVLSLSLLTGCSIGDGKSADSNEKTVIFTDSLGREVEVPENITRYAVTGPLAQITCFAIDPDEMVALASEWDASAAGVLDDKYLDLPVLGQLYGGKDELNKESLLEADPQVIIDVGEPKDTGASDLDEITETTGVPAVFIESSLSDYQTTYEMLGQLLGCAQEGEELGAYCNSIYTRTSDNVAKLGENKTKILYCLGDLGCNVLAKDSYQSQVIDLVANNLAVVENPSAKGIGNEVDFEQILNWNPDFIVFATDSYYEYVKDDEKWMELNAIKNGNYVEVPDYVYNWMGYPPSVQRYLGMMWLESVLYPDSVAYDLKSEVQSFYDKFLHVKLSDKQYNKIVKNSAKKLK